MRESVGVVPTEEHTVIELTGTDRPGLLSEICAVLTDLHCNVVTAEIWTHNTRAAAVVHVTDDSSGCAIKDPSRLSTIRDLLSNVLRGSNDPKTARTTLSPHGVTNRDRRLHQIMFADRDYERIERAGRGGLRDRDKRPLPHVTVVDCVEKDYTVVTMRAQDRPKLLFDIVCTLTDMQYVVFHGVVKTLRMEAFQVSQLSVFCYMVQLFFCFVCLYLLLYLNLNINMSLIFLYCQYKRFTQSINQLEITN